ncbi:phosphoribosylformylglycinamidine synthase subunit PurQ [Candidatus Woesearchaeota archaeon]|nr:phosphoribosylformylglycinamidine synthase subunit PurQ [Candidatus Woesearchaeota archaeon]
MVLIRAQPRAAIVVAEGSNCQRESREVLRHVGFSVDTAHINDLLSGGKRINDYDFLFVIGGFSYGDYIKAGKRLAFRLQDPSLAGGIDRFYEDNRLLLGICNGFQILTHAGMLPTTDDPVGEQAFTLDYNTVGGFRNQWVALKNVNRGNCVFTKGIEETLWMPMRNGEGRFVPKGYPDGSEVEDLLRRQDQVVFEYALPEKPFLTERFDPTGSVKHIAGVCNTRGTWMGMMPHPECAHDPFTDPRWQVRGAKGEGDGVIIFRNAYEYAKRNL